MHKDKNKVDSYMCRSDVLALKFRNYCVDDIKGKFLRKAGGEFQREDEVGMKE